MNTPTDETIDKMVAAYYLAVGTKTEELYCQLLSGGEVKAHSNEVYRHAMRVAVEVMFNQPQPLDKP